MTSYVIWKYAHILMFVFWVGTDMGVFLAARRCTDPKLSFVTRVTLLHMALRIELLPRTMWKAALPFGVMLSRDLGLLPVSAGVLAASLGIQSRLVGDQHERRLTVRQTGGPSAGPHHQLADLAGRGSADRAGLSSWVGYGPIVPDAGWLQLKVALYGLINLFVIWMIVAFDPLGAAFGRLAVEGSGPEIEAIISRTMNRSTVIIWSTYLLIILVGFIGTTKLAG